MKLKLSGKELSKKYAYSNLIILGFCSLYLIIPYFLQNLVGDDFYIYSSFQNQTLIPTIFFFLCLITSITILTYDLKWHSKIEIGKLSIRSYRQIFFLTVFYLLIIIIRDLPLKLSGASRNEMLGAISSQLLPGFGFLLLLCMIAIIQLHQKKFLIIFCIVCFMVDLVHEGKIFVSYALLCLMFYLDDNRIKLSFKRIIILGCVGLSFLLLIFFMRAFAVGENPLLSVYAFFSEFMGVNATSGWAVEYNHAGLPSDLTDFDMTLRSYYLGSVGHGLALSPVAYFLGNFGSLFYVVTFIYCIIITCVGLIGNRTIGKYSLLVILYNLIHLLRHGPNLFLSKCIFQILFLTLFFMWLNNASYRKNLS